jgi:hypothetical protein
MASFQPRFPEIRYAIGRFVVDRANALGLSRRDLVNWLGYQGRESKGHQVLLAFMAGENLNPPFVMRLPSVLQVEPSIVDAALISTARELDAEDAVRVLTAEEIYKSRFKPHLQVQCERSIPSPIFPVALIGVRKLRILELPDDAASSDDDARDRIAMHAIRCHYRENRGWVPCFGQITGYVLVVFPGYDGLDFGMPFDCRGRPTGSMTTVQRLPDALLGIRRGDGRLSQLFRNQHIQVTP